jgi:hypothetical protein
MAVPVITITITITTTSGTLHGSDFHISIYVRGDVRKRSYLYWAETLAASGAAAMRGPELGLGCEV